MTVVEATLRLEISKETQGTEGPLSQVTRASRVAEAK